MKSKEFQENNNPVLSVDTKKKENIGNFKNNGEEWMPKGEWEEVNTHDFPDKELGKAAPYGIYDMTRNEGWVNVGISHTAEFAVNSVRTWWNNLENNAMIIVQRLCLQQIVEEVTVTEQSYGNLSCKSLRMK